MTATHGPGFDSPLGKQLLEALPPFEFFSQGEEATYYGAHFLIADALGIANPPPTRTTWSHGWIDAPEIINPYQLISFGSENDRHLVSNRQVQATLQRFGFKDVHPVGLPIIYADQPGVQRLKGSLLVMPAHSLGHTRHTWPFADYAKAIAKLRDRFSLVVLCLHPSCLENRYWFEDFQKEGIPWVLGAAGHDRNALKRMQTLLRSFEFVTTNSSGSHLAYAAYCGAKPSFYGPFAELEAEDFARDPYYSKYPDIKAVMVRDQRRAATLERWPHLFTEPEAAQQRTAWGAEAVGADCRRTPAEIAALLGWDVERLRATRRPQWSALPRELRLGPDLSSVLELEVDGLAADRDYALAAVVAASAPTSGKTPRIYGRVWPLARGPSARAAFRFATTGAELRSGGVERAPSYSWNEEAVTAGRPYRLWVTLHEVGKDAALLEHIAEVRITGGSGGPDSHAQKDIDYHQAIAREYDLVVVAPRAITNALAFARFSRLLPRGGKMLDLGCGTGHMSLRFGDRFEDVVAVDHSDAMLAQARRKASLKGLTRFTALRGDVLEYIAAAKDAEFALICCTGFLHHLKPEVMARLFSHVARSLTPHGLFLMQEPIEVPAGSVPPRIQRWNANSVAARLDYSEAVTHEEDPDEAPLALFALNAALSASGLKVVKMHRNWEIFPQHLPPTASDWLTIGALNAAFGHKGNVLAVAARKA